MSGGPGWNDKQTMKQSPKRSTHVQIFSKNFLIPVNKHPRMPRQFLELVQTPINFGNYWAYRPGVPNVVVHATPYSGPTANKSTRISNQDLATSILRLRDPPVGKLCYKLSEISDLDTSTRIISNVRLGCLLPNSPGCSPLPVRRLWGAREWVPSY